jgi:hypothetical protein
MKAFNWCVKLVLTVLIATVISMVTTFYVVSAYLQELLKPFQPALAQNPLEFSEFIGNLWSQANILGQEGTKEPGKERSPEPDPNNASKPDDAVAVWAQGGAGQLQDKMVMTEEQFLSARDRLTDADKMTVFSMLVPKLPAEQLQHISTLVEGGITAEELAEIAAIVEQHLTPEEYQKLLEIVSKY